MTSTTESDAGLVARCREGDEAAWAELVERFSRYVYAILVGAFRLSDHEAEDIFQEVFARAFERLDGLRDDGAVRPWLAQTARRLAIDRLRAAGRETPSAEVPDDVVDHELAQLEDALAVRDALEGLPEHCREVIDRFFARDESYRTIAAALDLPPGTIASRISRCLAKLRSELDQAGFEPGRKAGAPASG